MIDILYAYLTFCAILSGALSYLCETNHVKLSWSQFLRLHAFSVPTWCARMLFLEAPLFLIGLAAVPLAQTRVTDSPQYPGRRVKQFTSAWMAPWNNPEDGVDGMRGGDAAQEWWRQEMRGFSAARVIFKWSCLRNPINGLRYVPVLCPKFDPAAIRSVGTGDEPPDGQGGWAFTWQGFYSGLYVKTPTRWVWLGWKFSPSDAKGILPDDTRLPRADFAHQFKRLAVK